MSNRAFALASALILTAGLASPLAAQSADPLKGPTVTDRGVPGTAGQFGTPVTEKKAREREIPHRAFMDALHKALGADAPEAVRLSAEQSAKIAALDKAHSEAMAAFLRDNKDAGEVVRRAVRERAVKADKGKKPAQGEAAMTEGDAVAMREKAEAIRAAAPKAADVRAQMWTVLSEAQHTAVNARLDEFKAKQQARMNEEYVQKRAAQKRGELNTPAGQKPEGVKPGKPSAERVPAEFRERLLALIERLTPEQREQLLQRLQQRLEAAKSDREGGAVPPARTRKGE